MTEARRRGGFPGAPGRSYCPVGRAVGTPLLCLLLVLAGLLAPLCLPAQAARPAPAVMPGIDVLSSIGYAPLKGKRVGLLTHPAGVNRFGVSTVEVLRRAPGVNLGALYGLGTFILERGGYESIKSKGLDLISDPALRRRVVGISTCRLF